ncbi:MAG TPA: bifunctional tetrahydrofolate synthase/dihydrofolate synthase [Burkholderiaceae bacterium]|nr:bifunctional tetrahydrofolate synthase/dihydrofolate synthase [Burkholderiaceae bacterium]
MTTLPLTQHSSLDQWLEHLETLHPSAIDLGLERIRQVYQRLNLNPKYLTISVAGTNGKGSSCALLDAIVRSAGYRTGVYTSPHLIDFNERIRIQGEKASDKAIVEQFERVEKARGDVSLTYFEFATLAALCLFDQSNLDVVILEAGLGGRLDAVNIVDADAVLFTSIDLDHTDWLGDTRDDIAFEKAHLMRQGRPAICADPVPPKSLRDYADKVGADLWLFGRDYNYSGDRLQWAYGGREQRRSSLAYPALRGANQLLNAAGVLAVLESLHPRLAIPQQAVRIGLAQVELAGRFQVLPGQPVTVLDVAHNLHAVAALRQNLDGMGRRLFPHTHAVVGLYKDKAIDAILAEIASRIDYWYCANTSGPRQLSGAELAQHVQQYAKIDAELGPGVVRSFELPTEAFSAAQDRAAVNDRILVFGSFTVVGPILKHLGRASG